VDGDEGGRRVVKSVALAAAAILLAAHSASAQITGITAPKTVFVGFPVPVTVTGTGNCNVQVDYGDKTPPVIGLLNTPLPHTYALDAAKTYPLSYTVTASTPNVPNFCTGSATTSISVKMFALKITPTLTDMMLLSKLSPGGVIVLKGLALGPKSESESKLYIRLPGNKVRQVVSVLEWANEYIVARIPDDIAGEVRGPCAFQAATAGGKKTAWFSGKLAPLTCTPTEDYAVIDPAHVTVKHCSDDAGDNKCNSVTSGHWNAFTTIAKSQPHLGVVTLDSEGTAPAGASIDSRHDSDWGLASDDDTDTYTISLKNGWKVDHVEFESAHTNNASASVKQAIAADASTGTLVVHYHIGASGGWVVYGAGIVIRGPKGVPY
jgi:hypothetical protein